MTRDDASPSSPLEMFLKLLRCTRWPSLNYPGATWLYSIDVAYKDILTFGKNVLSILLVLEGVFISERTCCGLSLLRVPWIQP